MVLSKVASFVLRGLQLLFAVIALALFVVLAKGQIFGSVPVTTGFCATAAAYAVLASLIGFAAIFVSRLSTFALVIIDALAVGLTLAGAIAYSVYMRHANCSKWASLVDNNLLNCGTFKYKGDNYRGCNIDDDGSEIKTRCGEAKAGDAFLYLTAIMSIATVALSFVAWRRAKSGRNY